MRVKMALSSQDSAIFMSGHRACRSRQCRRYDPGRVRQIHRGSKIMREGHRYRKALLAFYDS